MLVGRPGPGHVLSGAGRPRHGLTPGWPWQDPRANTDPECNGGARGAGREWAGFCRVTRPWTPNLLYLHSREKGLWMPRAMSVHLCAGCRGRGVGEVGPARVRVCHVSMPAPPAARKCVGRTRLLLPAAGRQRAPSDRALSRPPRSRPGSSLGRQVGS